MSEKEPLPPFSLQKMPITATIPYNYRWRILQAKLILSDLKELCEKYAIMEACQLYETVREEIARMLVKLREEIESKRQKIEAITK